MLVGLAGSRWRGARPRLNIETGQPQFDYDDPSVAFELVLREDGTGIGYWPLWSLSCDNDKDTCEMRWHVDGLDISFSPAKDPLWSASWRITRHGDKLMLSTTGAELRQSTGTISLYDGHERMIIEEGTCTFQKRGGEPHTAPCHMESAGDHQVLTYEELDSSDAPATETLHWYPDIGQIVSPPAHIFLAKTPEAATH